MKSFRAAVFVLFLFSVLLNPSSSHSEAFRDNSSCQTEFNVQFSPDQNSIINNNPQSLSCFVKISDDSIEIIPESNELSDELAPADIRFPFPPRHRPNFLRLKATITAPSVSGEPLRATDVFYNGHYGVVTYNTEGENYAGAFQIVDLADPEHPVLIYQVIFDQREFNTGIFEPNSLLLVGAQSKDITGHPSPAEIQRIALDSDFLPTLFSTPINLPSYTAFDLVSTQDSLYVVTGNAGGLVQLDKTTLAQKAYLPLDDARGIDLDRRENKIYVFQGTPGRMTIVNPEDFSYQTYSVGGASIPVSKGTIQVSDQLVFIAAGDGGTLLVSQTGRVLATISNPPGADPKKQATNAVSAYDQLIFIANGESGLRVARWSVEGRALKTFVFGKLNFGDLNGGVNGVTFQGRYAFVAADLGGLKIVKVSSPYPWPKRFPEDLNKQFK